MMSTSSVQSGRHEGAVTVNGSEPLIANLRPTINEVISSLDS